VARGKRVTIPIELDASGLRRGANDATRALKKFDNDGTRAIRGVDDATTRLSGNFRRAARYAAGAAAAYVSIDQARAAVETTVELGKGTLLLSRNLGLSTKTASSFAAVAKARGADVKALSMSFASLSRNVESAKSGSEASIDTFKGLGITVRDLNTLSPDQLMSRIAAGVEDMGTGFERMNVQRTLFGRGWQTISGLLREGPEALKDNLREATNLGAAFDDLSLSKIEGLIGAQRRLKLAQMGLQISFTQIIAPAVEDAADELARMSRILRNPNLSNTEKFDRIGDAIRNKITKVIPPVVRQIGRMAPDIAKALVQGFLQAPIWGQFLIGAWVAKKFPMGAFGAAGKTAGTKFATAFIAGTILFLNNNQPAIENWIKKNLPFVWKIMSGLPDPELFARGGTVPGTGSGDTVPAMLEPGEFVVNRRAVRAIGEDTLRKVNDSVPRFADGGMVGRAATAGSSTLGSGLSALEIALATAQLTPDTTDDVAAATKLRDYWRSRSTKLRDLFVVKPRNVHGKKGTGDYFGLLPFQWLQAQKFLRTTGKKPLKPKEISAARDRAREAARGELLAALQSQSSYESMISSSSESDGTADLLRAQNELLAQQAADRQAMLNVSQSQYGVLVQALAAAVSGHIGGKVGLGSQAPSVAGRLAAY
jgi:hypothetical protein